MRMKIILDTGTAAARLVSVASSVKEPVYLTDGAQMRISAKSLLGAICAQFDFNEIWLETEGDHYWLFSEFAAEE